jgi:hypothetical protein
MLKRKNPFNLPGYTAKKYFCDREDELTMLHENFDNDRNTVLFSWRRMRKTLLIKFFLSELEQSRNVQTMYIDLLATRDSEEAIKVISTARYERYGKTSKGGLSQTFQKLMGRLGI